MHFVRNGGRNRRKSECGVVKGSGKSGVESACVDNTYFRILEHKDSCFTHEQVRHVIQSVSKRSCTYSARNLKQWSWRWLLVFWMGVHQSSYVPSRIRVKASFLDDNQEQQAKCECFAVLVTVRTQKTRANQVDCVLGALFHHSHTLTRITWGLHLHVSTWNCISQDRSGCSPHTVKPWRKSLRILCQDFIRKIYGMFLSTRLEDGEFWRYSCKEILTFLTL